MADVIGVLDVFLGMMSMECDGKCHADRSWQRCAAIFAKSGWRHAKSRAEGARKSFVILESGFERDIQDGCARGQQQPRPAIQSEPTLVCSRCFAEHLHHQSMKLPTGKTSGSRHGIDRPRILSCTKSPAQTTGRLPIFESRSGLKHRWFSIPGFSFLPSPS